MKNEKSRKIFQKIATFLHFARFKRLFVYICFSIRILIDLGR